MEDILRIGEHATLFKCLDDAYLAKLGSRTVSVTPRGQARLEPLKEPQLLDAEGKLISTGKFPPPPRNWAATVPTQLIAYDAPPERLDALVLKRDEYDRRIEKEVAEHEATHPGIALPAIYEHRNSWSWTTLSLLLRHGSLELWAISEAVHEKYGETPLTHIAGRGSGQLDFYKSYDVISAYIDGSHEQRIEGGTGLQT